MNLSEALETLDAISALENNIRQNSECLPKAMWPNKETFESLGFTFMESDDPLSYEATLPEGWSTKFDEGWGQTNIYDDKGLCRGYYIYSGSFWDPTAIMRLQCRYDTAAVEIGDDFEKREFFIRDRGTGKMLLSFGECVIYSPSYDECKKRALSFLEAEFPNWRDPLSYWDKD